MKKINYLLIALACWLLLPAGAQKTESFEWTVYPITDSSRRTEDGPLDQWTDHLAVAGDGTVWVTTRSGLMAYLEGGTWHTLHDVSETLFGGSLFFFCCFTAAPDGTVWMSYLQVLGSFHNQTWTFYVSDDARGNYGNVVPDKIKAQGVPVIKVEDNLVFDRTMALATDSEGTLWVATQRGLIRFDGKAWTVFRKGEGLIDDSISAITIAPDDSVWVLTGDGLAHFDGKRWMNYQETAGLFSLGLARIAVAADGKVWGIKDGKIVWFDGQRWGNATALDGLDVGVVWSLTTGPDGTIWAGSLKGLSHFDGTRWTHYPLDMNRLPGSPAINAPGITGLDVAPDGSVWCGTQRGVARFRLID
jgi:hypothetical protein